MRAYRRLPARAAGAGVLLIVISAFALAIWSRSPGDTGIPPVAQPEGEGVTVLTRMEDANTIALRSPTFR